MSNTPVVIVSVDFILNVKSLSPSLAKIVLDAVYRMYPNLIVTDVVLNETTGNVSDPSDRLIAEWIERHHIPTVVTEAGARLRDGEISLDEAAALSIDEASRPYITLGGSYHVWSDGGAWFRFKPLEPAHIELKAERPLLRHFSDMARLNDLRMRSH